jgi:PAS domain S-box-containing protein
MKANKLQAAEHPSREAEMTRVLEELKLHQTELEMQNDELQLANEKLEIQQRKYAGVNDLAPIGFYILDQDGYINEINHIGISMLEAPRSKVLRQQLQRFIGPDDRDAYHRFFRLLSKSGKRESCQLTMQTFDGKLIHVQMEGLMVREEHIPVQCNIVLTDITNRIRIEDDLRLTRQRLQFSLLASSSGIWHLELKSMHIHLDDMIIQSWMPEQLFDGKYTSFIKLLHPEDQVSTDYYFRKAIAGGHEIDVSCRLGDSSATKFYVRIRGQIIDKGTSAERYTGIIMNVTEKTLLEIKQKKVIAFATHQAEEKERRRISESLHDSVSQLLYAVRLKLALVPGAADQESVLQDVYQLLDIAVLETRNVSFTLAPSILTDFGLPATIKELALRLSNTQLTITTNLSKFSGRVDPQLETVIFRIIQELVNNCLKHAHATAINIELRKSKFIYVTVSDNGCDFTPDETRDTSAGSGLSSIKNRLVHYNGAIQITSRPGEGTEVNIKIDENNI